MGKKKGYVIAIVLLVVLVTIIRIVVGIEEHRIDENQTEVSRFNETRDKQ